MGIHNAILEHIETVLTAAMITALDADDPSRAGLVKIGPMQGDPGPDTARISVTIFENDPDRIAKGGVSGMNDDWSDGMDELEIGGTSTVTRRFSIKLRCLFAETREDEKTSRTINSDVRDRLEKALKRMSFSAISTSDEYVARGVNGPDFGMETIQAGGPPDAFDYLTKVHFSVITTQTGINS